MSIDNIFKCCKKNYIITGLSGVMLGAYGSYYGLSGFLGPVYNYVEVPPSAPLTPNISEPIIVPISEPRTYADIFLTRAAMVAFIGGLAVLTYGAHKYLMSRDNFQFMNDVKNPIVVKDIEYYKDMSRKLNERHPVTNEDLKKAGVKGDLEKMRNELNDEYEKLKNERGILKNTLDEILKIKGEMNLGEKFSFFGGKKEPLFMKGNKFKFENEREEISENEQEKLESMSNQLLAKLEGNASEFVKIKLFTAYKENIPKLSEEKIEEEVSGIISQTTAIQGIFAELGFKENVSIRAMLNENINDIQANMALNLATASFDDFNNFLQYGAKQVLGTPIVNWDPSDIVYKYSAMNIIPLPTQDATYLNAPKRITILNFDGKNFVSRLALQYKVYIIPIFSRIVSAGIGRFDERLAQMLYITSNFKFSKSMKISTIPGFNSDMFLTQFEDKLNYLVEKSHWKSDTDHEKFKEFVMQKTGNDKLEYKNIRGIDIVKTEVKKVYKEIMKRYMRRRNAYIDFIMIYNKLYEFIFPDEYAQMAKKLNENLERNVENFEVVNRSLTTSKF